MTRIGITGGIGCGKSYVARDLATRQGIPVYDCDSEAKRIMVSSPEICKALTALLGERYTKQTITDYLFASPDNAARINAIVHPAVKADFLRWADEQNAETVAIESAILIQAGFTDIVDKVIVVTASMELRIQRVMARDNCTREEVERRIAAQLPEDVLLKHADYVIINENNS